MKSIAATIGFSVFLVSGPAFAHDWEFDCWPHNSNYDHPILEEPRCQFHFEIDDEYLGAALTKDQLDRKLSDEGRIMREFLRVNSTGTDSMAMKLKRNVKPVMSPSEITRRANEYFQEQMDTREKAIDIYVREMVGLHKDADELLGRMDWRATFTAGRIKASARVVTATTGAAITAGPVGGLTVGAGAALLESLALAYKMLPGAWDTYKAKSVNLEGALGDLQALTAQAEDFENGDISDGAYKDYIRKIKDADRTVMRHFALVRSDLMQSYKQVVEAKEILNDIERLKADTEDESIVKWIEDVMAFSKRSGNDLDELVRQFEPLVDLMDDLQKAHAEARSFLNSRDPEDLAAISRWHKKWRTRFDLWVRTNKQAKGNIAATYKKTQSTAAQAEEIHRRAEEFRKKHQDK